jgi:hypothetical protein
LRIHPDISRITQLSSAARRVVERGLRHAARA